ncbi:unnamed protein product [Paramecium primaurelia]|uniref:Uncharacterized protein n=1 Tax=Paramecium primaurelia TaxID=5886 RepID=A0A8S1JNU8_PARPR|nr:unnamed protein product [Paramecium primaurelia]
MVISQIFQDLFYKIQGQDGEFNYQLEQSINFGYDCVYGTISHDGQFLITWDYKSHKTQIKKYYQKIDQQIWASFIKNNIQYQLQRNIFIILYYENNKFDQFYKIIIYSTSKILQTAATQLQVTTKLIK